METNSTDSETTEVPEVIYTGTSDKLQICGKILHFFRGITMELVVFFSSLGLGALSVTVQNYYMKIVCYQIYDIDIQAGRINDTCYNLSLTNGQEKIVQNEVGYYLAFRDAIETGIPAFLAILWFGEWCDKFGCKPLLLLALIGNILSSMLFYIFYMEIFTTLTPLVLVTASIPIAIGGGSITLSLASFTYIAKVIMDEENRSTRLTVVAGATFLGTSLGILFGNLIYKHGGYGTLFCSTTGAQTIALAYTILFLKNDKLEVDDPEHSSIFSCSEIFGISSVVETIATFTKSRAGRARLWLMLLALYYGLNVFTNAAISNLGFLYPRLVFKWNQDDYTNFAVIDAGLYFLGLSFTSIVFLKWLKLKEIPVIVLGTIFYAVACGVWGMGKWGGTMYIGSLISSLNGICSPLSRSLAAQIVPVHEIGKINTFLSLEDAIMPLIGGPLFVVIYNFTKDIYPGTAFYINGVLTLLCLPVLSVFWVSFKRSNDYNTLE